MNSRTANPSPIAGGGPQRDVYAYVMVKHMPATLDEKTPVPNQPGSTGQNERGAVADKLGKVVPGRVGVEDAARIKSLFEAGQISQDDVEAIMPTYGVYVWHDTGVTAKRASGTTKVIDPQPAFAYFVADDGTLTGWLHGFAGLGVVVTEVAKDFYRLSVPEGGSVEVMTTVEAHETTMPPPVPPPSSPPWWLLLLIVAVIVVIIVFVLVRKKGP